MISNIVTSIVIVVVRARIKTMTHRHGRSKSGQHPTAVHPHTREATKKTVGIRI